MRAFRLLVALLLLLACAGARGGDRPCADPRIVASAWSDDESRAVCDAVDVALRVLETMTLSPAQALVVAPLDASPDADDRHPIGRYDPRKARIEIARYAIALAASRERSPGLGVPMSRPVWASYIAHELAHALAEPRFAPGVPRLTASEYIAAVAQLDALPAALRDAVLAQYAELPGWGAAREINAGIYFIDPAAFAVKSYRHYRALSRDAQREWIETLLRHGLNH